MPPEVTDCQTPISPENNKKKSTPSALIFNQLRRFDTNVPENEILLGSKVHQEGKETPVTDVTGVAGLFFFLLFLQLLLEQFAKVGRSSGSIAAVLRNGFLFFLG